MSYHRSVNNFALTITTVKSRNRHPPNPLPGNTPVRAPFQHVPHAVASPSRNPLHALIDFAQGHSAQRLAVNRFSADKVTGEVRADAVVLIFFQRFFARLVHRDEPLRRSPKDHWILAAPAMRIPVIVIFAEEQHTLLAHKFDDLWIRLKDAKPGEVL